MLQEIKDYTKCAVKNKFIIGSYTGIGFSLLIRSFEHKTGVRIPIAYNFLLYPSLFTLGTTKFGLETFKAYRRMKNHILEYKTINPEFRNKFSKLYCTQIGIKLAVKEAGLEDLL